MPEIFGAISKRPDFQYGVLGNRYGNYFIAPLMIIPSNYPFVLSWISIEIRRIFLNCSHSDETKFKTEMETISHLIKLFQKTSSELKSLGSNVELLKSSIIKSPFGNI